MVVKAGGDAANIKHFQEPVHHLQKLGKAGATEYGIYCSYSLVQPRAPWRDKSDA